MNPADARILTHAIPVSLLTAPVKPDNCFCPLDRLASVDQYLETLFCAVRALSYPAHQQLPVADYAVTSHLMNNNC